MRSGIFTENGIPNQENCPLAPMSTFRIGGRASLAVFPQDREQLIRCLSILREERLPFEVIGNASNLILPDGTYPGILLITRNARSYRFDGISLVAEAGAALPALACAAMKKGLSGLEFAQGIPGTVGGGVLMNAGAFGGSMADVLVSSEWYDCETGRLGQFAGKEHGFGVRTSVYEREKRYILLEATLRLQPDDQDAIRNRMEAFRLRRAQTQPVGMPSAGSIFRHPPGAFAGRLIEDCGLKGTRIGGAEVSTKHAGFIVNRGGATAKDVQALIALIRERVQKETGYWLECEVRTLGAR